MKERAADTICEVGSILTFVSGAVKNRPLNEAETLGLHYLLEEIQKDLCRAAEEMEA